MFSYTPDTGDHAFAVRNSGSSEATASSSVNVVEPVTESDEATVSTDICKDAEPGIDQGDTYIVGLCEWLVKIANRLGIEYEALIGVNPQIGEPNLIYPGQVINLPPR
ncbi:MAG: LysM peptidoglycan-binding domain-containing protein [Chloroflexi bacterium]|nr:LysM peptidoglycan-binding domain-containing protein [Chloroflexota bacterium]